MRFRLSRQRDSNSRPLPYHGSALPLSYVGASKVWTAGFEPATSPARGERATKLRYAQYSDTYAYLWFLVKSTAPKMHEIA